MLCHWIPTSSQTNCSKEYKLILAEQRKSERIYFLDSLSIRKKIKLSKAIAKTALNDAKKIVTNSDCKEYVWLVDRIIELSIMLRKFDTAEKFAIERLNRLYPEFNNLSINLDSSYPLQPSIVDLYRIRVSKKHTPFYKSKLIATCGTCLLYTSPSPRDRTRSRMPSSA